MILYKYLNKIIIYLKLKLKFFIDQKFLSKYLEVL